jgi:hypothetical protein
MAYIIKKTNGQKLTTVDDGSINITACDITLLGKNYSGYGQPVNENFIKLLENFSSPKQPAKPVTGQLWYDSTSRKIKFYNGSTFKNIPALESSSQKPTDLKDGDFWFNTTNKKLFYFNGVEDLLIGPQFTGSTALNTILPDIIVDTEGTEHNVLKYLIETSDQIASIIAVASSDQFDTDISLHSDYAAFPVIKKGLTLASANTSTGATAPGTSDYPIFWGSAAHSLRLGNHQPEEYVLYDNPTFETTVNINVNSGINIQSYRLGLFVSDFTGYPTISTSQGVLTFTVNDLNVINLENDSQGTALLPSRDTNGVTDIGREFRKFGSIWGGDFYSTNTTVANLFVTNAGTFTNGVSLPSITKTGTSGTGDIGQVSKKFGTVYANTFNGALFGNAQTATTSTNSTNILVGSTYRSASTSTTANTLAVRDYNGDLWGTYFRGVAIQAQYADLAENYLSDATYEPGTVLVIGGQAEVTMSTTYESEAIAGIVSTDPAYLMNSELENSVAIALKGRVPCKVKGPIKKGDILVSSDVAGHAEARRYGHRTNPLAVLGKALQDFDGEFGVIEVMVY